MLLRALLAFLALPGVVAGAVPFVLSRFDPLRGEGTLFGLVMLGVGLALLLWCVRDFYVVGRGTLAPWDPPRSLVVAVLYLHVLNPMYVAVLCVLLGWVMLTASPMVLVFAGFMWLFFHLMVTTHEEPRAEETFGEEWRRYRAGVRRWLPRVTPYDSGPVDGLSTSAR